MRPIKGPLKMSFSYKSLIVLILIKFNHEIIVKWPLSKNAHFHSFSTFPAQLNRKDRQADRLTDRQSDRQTLTLSHTSTVSPNHSNFCFVSGCCKKTLVAASSPGNEEASDQDGGEAGSIGWRRQGMFSVCVCPVSRWGERFIIMSGS